MSKDEDGRNDPRKSYILRVASHIAALNLVEDKLSNVRALHKFCDSATPLLVFNRYQQKSNVVLSNELKEDNPISQRIIFYKLNSVPLTDDNYKRIVGVLTSQAQLNQTLLASLQQVFSKSLLKTSANRSPSVQANTQLISLVKELEHTLSVTNDIDKQNSDGLYSLREEIRYWRKRSEEKSNDDTAVQYYEAFESLADKIDVMREKSLEELSEFIQDAEDCIYNLWHCVEPYPENRMKQLIHRLGNALVDAITDKIDATNLWRDEKTVELIQIGISLCDEWNFTVKRLTQQSSREGEWKEESNSMDFVDGFRGRLNQLLSLKMLSVQIGQLLNEKNAQKETEEILENVMKDFNPLLYNPFTEPQWKSKLQVIERNIEATIQKVIPVLRKRFQPTEVKSNLVVYDLVKYKHFLNRPQIKERLIAERFAYVCRETLLSRLTDSVSSKKREFDERLNGGDVPTGRYLTEVAAKIIWIRQQITEVKKSIIIRTEHFNVTPQVLTLNRALGHKTVENAKTLSEELLSELNNYRQLKSIIEGSLEEMRATQSDLFDSWCREISEAIDSHSDAVSLETSGKVMSIEQRHGTLNVNYSDRLVRLLKEVRQLTSLGFNVPSKIIKCANLGEKFYKSAIVLKQVAHFYNTIEQQMLPCQQAMMLDEALAFEKLVIAEKGSDAPIANLTWNDPKQLDNFIGKLQQAAERLSVRNRLCDIIVN
ncbi:unnamed protein product [Anisakis simplex]|uniref:DHC_N1 domain-containing protein n=1 Tax=Anisakis simplex TaxID=6269 RepID=A0A0M3JXW1_ANISI|nr:unnamed protein product [Anisakis simplex]